jgi:hypothetical protein
VWFEFEQCNKNKKKKHDNHNNIQNVTLNAKQQKKLHPSPRAAVLTNIIKKNF